MKASRKKMQRNRSRTQDYLLALSERVELKDDTFFTERKNILGGCLKSNLLTLLKQYIKVFIEIDTIFFSCYFFKATFDILRRFFLK